MASNKTYTVMKDGEILKELKTLAAAKKLADTEDAEVFTEGLCVYAPDPPVSEDVEEPPVEATAPVKPEKYTLTAKMNIRKAPSISADKLGIAQKNTVVEAVPEGDWLHLTDGTFILSDGGKFAVKC
jgi:hypothetical protein